MTAQEVPDMPEGQMQEGSSAKLDSIQSAIESVYGLLDKILNANEVYSVEELQSILTQILPDNLTLHCVLRERLRFAASVEDPVSSLLYFSYFSFSWAEGKIERYLLSHELEAMVQRWEKDPGWDSRDAGKVVVFLEKGVESSVYLLASAVSRCLAATYVACGGFDHFLDNLASRFSRDYFAEPESRGIQEILEAIEGACLVNAAYVALESREAYAEIYDPRDLLGHLAEDEQFRRNLDLSIRKRATTTGRTASGECFSIHALAHDYFDPVSAGEGPQEEPAIRGVNNPPRGIVITVSRGDRLNRDVLAIAPRVFRTYLADLVFRQRQELFYSLLQGSGEVADKVHRSPTGTRAELQEQLYPFLERACLTLRELTFASDVVVRSLDAFDQSLVVVAAAPREEGSEQVVSRVPLAEGERFASARAFTESSPVGLSPGKADPDPEGMQLPLAEDFGLDGDSKKHVASVPIRVGKVTLGTIDFLAADAKFFLNDRGYLLSVANALGEFIRRVEAANDAAWLTQLSFLQGVRHPLAQLELEAQSDDTPLGARVIDIIDNYGAAKLSASPTDKDSLFGHIRRVCADRSANQAGADGVGVTNFVMDLSRMLAPFDPSPQAISNLTQAFDTLLSNAFSHATFDLNDFSMEVIAGSGQHSECLLVKYENVISDTNGQKLQRVCVSPIPDEKANGQHCGLFLLAAQIRMAGGCASGARLEFEDDEVYPFRVAIAIPLA